MLPENRLLVSEYSENCDDLKDNHFAIDRLLSVSKIFVSVLIIFFFFFRWYLLRQMYNKSMERILRLVNPRFIYEVMIFRAPYYDFY